MPEISRRTVIGAAWSAPVVLAAVAAPLAAASGQTASSVAWGAARGDFGGTSTITVTIPAGSAAVGSSGSILFSFPDTVGNLPSFPTLPAGWTYTPFGGGQAALLNSPSGLTAGEYVFTTGEWIDLSGSYEVLATWQSAAEFGSSTSLITVKPAGVPTVVWDSASASWGGTSILTVSVVADSYAAGELGVIGGFDSGLPTGPVLDPRQGWAVTNIQGTRALINPAVPVGDSTISFTWPAGSGTATVTAQFISTNGGVPVNATIQLG
ncbi:hypothetical protein SCB71_01580 [Herbiconiux sp. KACC 21604]|uniref:hypothetical protein n=1 Tax=unclassified Herbiconiux TaxID=2618217 RepID=UPI001491EF3B|nr:hypothetical protein [Herbiconiux sp. SALV-R1]QJU55751.1 hypothetical protein HL652_20440 [Herbiconiux sp. SALV-R1]WPO86959.1 hypothetical protein SCB71_01580 [Herbiconiux sp. KACC 21604]